MSSFLNKIFRQKTINRISKKCKLLGDYKKINVNIFLYLRIICSLFTIILFMFFSDSVYIYGPIVALLIYYGFEYVLDYYIDKRKNKLNYEAIFFFQVLVLSLESGKDLKSAIELTTKNINKEISSEFKKTIYEINNGKSLVEALNSMKYRIPSEEINTVILNIKESSLFGNNIVDSLNNQIEYLRDKQLNNIKGKINKMPIKVSVISVVFIVPIVLILGPVLINYLIK